MSNEFEMQNAIETYTYQHILYDFTIINNFQWRITKRLYNQPRLNHIFWKADSLNICKTYFVYHKLASRWRLNHIIIICRNFAHDMNSSIFKCISRANLKGNYVTWFFCRIGFSGSQIIFPVGYPCDLNIFQKPGFYGGAPLAIRWSGVSGFDSNNRKGKFQIKGQFWALLRICSKMNRRADKDL